MANICVLDVALQLVESVCRVCHLEIGAEFGCYIEAIELPQLDACCPLLSKKLIFEPR